MVRKNSGIDVNGEIVVDFHARPAMSVNKKKKKKKPRVPVARIDCRFDIRNEAPGVSRKLVCQFDISLAKSCYACINKTRIAWSRE